MNTHHFPKLLDQLYTMNFSVDDRFEISDVSSKLDNLYPNLLGRQLLEIFDCHRPKKINGFEDLAQHAGSLFLIVAKDRSLALRLQPVIAEDGKSARFVGSPWLAWMNDHNPERRLQLTDFPKLDAQMDQQFYLASQQTMVNDLEKLNSELLRAKEDAIKSNRIRTDLFAVMSHEMRTPLNGVISALTLMEDDKADNKRLLELARQSANGLMTVINFALDYAKIDAGKMNIDYVDFEPMTLVQSIEAVAQTLIAGKDVQFEIIRSDNLPVGLRGDEERLKQILINLVGNAIKYTESGKVTVTVEWTQSDQLSFTISDTGCGIPSYHLDKIFEPFWTSTSGNEKIQSTGLGLNIARQLTDLLNGSLSVTSTEKVGSEFKLTVPMSEVVIKHLHTERASEDVDSQLIGRVLVVDDNQTNLVLAEMLLEKLGLQTRKASSAEDAIEIARDVPFDAILMDIMMPGMDGMQATRRINEFDGAPPIIACTANVGPDYARQYLASGFSGYLQKPIEPHKLRETLGKWLPTSPSTDSVQETKKVVCTHSIDKLFKEIGAKNFERILTLFLSESQKRMTSLLSAWVSRDYDKLILESHALASSSASFGAERLSHKLKRIEAYGRDRAINPLIEEISELEKHFREGISVIEAYEPGGKS